MSQPGIDLPWPIVELNVAVDDRVKHDRIPAALGDWRFLIALVLLVLNDGFLKASHPSWLTGKLSDFAGMVVFPVVLASLVGLATPQLAARHSRRVQTFSLAVAGLTLLAIKTIPAAAAGMESLLQSITGAEQQIVVDSTDLLGLSGLIIASRALKSPNRVRLGKKARLGILGVAALACVATSAPENYASNWNNIVETDGSIIVTGDQTEFGWESTDDGATWAQNRDLGSEDLYSSERAPVNTEPITLCPDSGQSLCIQLADTRIRESLDGGQSWETVWEIDPEEGWVEGIGYSVYENVIIAPGDLHLTESGSIIAAVGGIEPIRRAPNGTWSPSVANLRTLPGSLGFASVAVVALCLSAIQLLRVRAIGHGIVSAIVGSTLGFIVINEMVSGPESGRGFYSLLAAMAALGTVGIAFLIWIVQQGTKQPTKHRRYQRVPVTDLAPGAIGTVLVWVPLAVWASGVGDWKLATNATAAIGIAAVGFTFAVVQLRPFDESSIPPPLIPPPPGFPGPPPIPSLAPGPPPPPHASVSYEPTQFYVSGIYRRPLITFAFLGVLGFLAASYLAMLLYAFQGIVLNRAGRRLPHWELRFVSATLIIPLTLGRLSGELFPLLSFGDYQYWALRLVEIALVSLAYLAHPRSESEAADDWMSV